MYIRSDIPFSQRHDLGSDDLEILCCDILLPKTRPIVVGTCYRPPKQTDFIDKLEELLFKIRTDSEIYLLGDFNICFFQKYTSFCKKYLDVLRMFNLKQLITAATRVTSSSSSLIDHILSNCCEKICQSGTISIGLSDHFLTYMTRKVVKGQISKHNFVKLRSMKHYSKDDFNSKLSNKNWESVLSCLDVEMAWDSFKDIFHSVLDIVAPLKEVRLKQRTEPWMNSDILQNIRHRDETLNKFRKSKDPDLYKEYCKLRNMVQRETRISKRDYLANKIEENVGNSKKLWNQLKKLGYSSKKKENSSVVLEIEGETCFDPKKVANCFNNFFTTVASNLVDKLPPSFNLFNSDSSRFQEFYAGKNVEPDEFILAPVSEDFIYKELCKLNPSKSTGTDNIPARFVKDAASVLTKPILHIVNLSIDQDLVPNDLKNARVVPLFKKNKRCEVGNYRPVSVLSVISKILERAVYTQLEDYLIKKKLMFDFQSGFRSNFSTDSCLTYLTDYIKSQTSKGLYTGMLMLDLQKAFDTVDHDILCKKLKAMGIKSVDWFRSYLSHRNQIVQVNDTVSDPSLVTCGVPQGSILGPLLFLCYINDMELSISHDSKLLLYADDSAILYSHKDPKVISEKLGFELEMCSKWLIDNKLSLHMGKTECILFGSKRKLRKVSDFSIECNGHTIKAQRSVKYLGLNLDDQLSGEAIVNSIVQKVNGRLKFLYRQCSFLEEKLRKSICSALIQCHLDYACSSWYSGLNKQLKKKLQICQNKTVRFIKNLGPRSHIGFSELDSLKMLNVDFRVKQLRLSHVHKINNETGPSYMSEHFIKTSEVHHHFTRNSIENFVLPSVCGAAAKLSIIMRLKIGILYP